MRAYVQLEVEDDLEISMSQEAFFAALTADNDTPNMLDIGIAPADYKRLVDNASPFRPDNEN
jgi:hypothetical protein